MIAEYFVYFSEGPAITFLMNSEKKHVSSMVLNKIIETMFVACNLTV